MPSVDSRTRLALAGLIVLAVSAVPAVTGVSAVSAVPAASAVTGVPAVSVVPAVSAAGADATFVPVETIQDLMLTQVDPSADALWASVSTTITAAGAQEKRPRTPAEWRAVRRLAVSLIEAGNLLLMAPRQVAERGSKTDDANVPGIESPQRMQRAIDADPAAFRRAAFVLRTASLKALSAIDDKDPEALTEAGGDLDAACEACHLRYWYPHSPRPR